LYHAVAAIDQVEVDEWGHVDLDISRNNRWNIPEFHFQTVPPSLENATAIVRWEPALKGRKQ